MPADLPWILLAYGYVAAVVAAAEILRRRALLSVASSRTFIHVGVGLFAIPTVLLFSDWRMAIVPPLTFAAANFVIYRFRLLPALGDDPTNPGAVFFPISFAILLAVFFRPGASDDLAHVAVAGLLCMTLGDAAAALFGNATEPAGSPSSAPPAPWRAASPCF